MSHESPDAGSDQVPRVGTFAQAKDAEDGVVILEADWGGRLLVVARAAVVACDEAALAQLLLDLDKWCLPEDELKGIQLIFGTAPLGGYVGRLPTPDEGHVIEDVWVHPELVQAGLEQAVREVISGKHPVPPRARAARRSQLTSLHPAGVPREPAGQRDPLRVGMSACRDLADLAEQAATHIERGLRRSRREEARMSGSYVFVGRGRSPLRRELKDFITERLALTCEEFNRVPVAGLTNVEQPVHRALPRSTRMHTRRSGGPGHR